MAEASAPSRAEFETLKDEVAALRDQLREQKEEMTSARPAPPRSGAVSQDTELKVLIGCYAEEIHGYANTVEASMAPLVASLNKLETRLAALHQKLPAVARRARPAPLYDYEDAPTNQVVVRRGRAALAPSAVCTTGLAAPQPPGSLGKVLQSQIVEYPVVVETCLAAAAAMPPRQAALRQVAEATEPAEAMVAVAVDEAAAAGIAVAEAAKVAAAAAATAAAAAAAAPVAAAPVAEVAAAPLPTFPALSPSEEEEGRRFRVLQPHALAREEEEDRRASRTPRTSPPARTSPQRTSPPRTPRDSAFPTRDSQPFSLPAAPGLSPVPPSRSPLGGMPLWESAPGHKCSSAARGGAAGGTADLPGTPSLGAPVHASVYSGQVGAATQPAACAGGSHPRGGAISRTALLYPAPGRQICVQRRPQTTQPGSRAAMAPPQLQAGNGAVRTLSPTARPVTSSGGRVAPPGAASNAGAWLPLPLAPSVAESQDRLADFLGGKAALISPRRGVAGAGSTTAAGSHLPPRPTHSSGRPRCAGSTGAVTNIAGY
jgi:hypothetical protein